MLFVHVCVHRWVKSFGVEIGARTEVNRRRTRRKAKSVSVFHKLMIKRSSHQNVTANHSSSAAELHENLHPARLQWRDVSEIPDPIPARARRARKCFPLDSIAAFSHCASLTFSRDEDRATAVRDDHFQAERILCGSRKGLLQHVLVNRIPSIEFNLSLQWANAFSLAPERLAKAAWPASQLT